MIKESIRIILQCFDDASLTEAIANGEGAPISSFVIMFFGKKKKKYRYFYCYSKPSDVVSRIREMLVSKQNSANTRIGPLFISDKFNSIDDAKKNISNSFFFRGKMEEFKSVYDVENYVSKVKKLRIIT